MSKIQEVMTQYGGNFARPTKFNVMLDPPFEIKGVDRSVDILAKEVQVPSMTLDTIDLSIKGHPLKYPARLNQNQEFSITFYVDEHYNIRNMFTDWISAMDNRYYGSRNSNTSQLVKNRNKYGNLLIIARDFDETANKPLVWAFEGVYPTNIGEINFSSENKDTIQEMTVTFAYYRFVHQSNTPETEDDLDSWLDEFGKTAIGNFLSRTELGKRGLSMIRSGMDIKNSLSGLGERLGGLFG
jgi:hypothetical protein